ncbi:MAG: ABC transporter ATP-binding protein [Phycisphaerales bacterium]|nr:MAG: ABC transporter ATP-binding protein [Phycisphaerales bacterium]
MVSIVAEDVSRCYESGRGVANVSLSVQAGQCLAVLGANGSGKTTLTRLVAGLDRPERGRLSVLDAPSCPRPAHLRKRCGVSLDASAHWERLSGRQNLCFFARQYGLAEPMLSRRADDLLAQANLLTQADDPVATYSFGMRRKLSIIEALVHDPDVLILDEPSAGVDAPFLERLTLCIRRRSEQGKTTWVADNDPDWLARTATHAVLLGDGRIEAQGTVPELTASIGARNRIEITLEQADWNQKPDLAGIHEFHCEGNHIDIVLDGDPELPARMLQWIVAHQGRVRMMEIHAVTLREALAQRAERQEAAS